MVGGVDVLSGGFGLNADSVRGESGSLNVAGVGARTPQYMIKCEDFFDSDVAGFEESATPCLWVKLGASRLNAYDAGGELSADGKIAARTTKTCMKYGSWAPIIQQYMFEGKNVKAISLIRFSSIETTKVIIQQIDYTTCKIESYEQDGDVITFSFSFVKMVDTNIAYDLEGKKIGNTAVEFDSSTLGVKMT